LGRVGRALFVALGLFAGADCVGPRLDFVCTNDAQCRSQDQPGVCEAAGYCSFSDDRCASGRRFAAHSAALSGTCVDSVGSVACDGGDCATRDPPDAGCVGPDCVCPGSGVSRACYPYGQGLQDATLNQGPCRAGMQVCEATGGGTGVWGSCANAVVPTAEACNGVDDNCDGRVDEGCPTSFVLASGVASPAFGNSAGGTAYDGACPSGQVGIGVSITSQPGYGIYVVSLSCGTISLQANSGAKPTAYSIAIGAGGTAGPFGMDFPSSKSDSYTCPKGSMLSGLSGALNQPSPGEDFVGFITLRCSSLSVDGGPGTYHLDRVAVETSPNLGAAIMGTAFSFDCANNQIFTGISGHAGSWIDQLAVRCGTPTLQLKP
jgi:hypothetical protein